MVKSPLLEKAWKSAKKNIFRLEALPEYAVPEDLVLFERWKQGKLELDKASKKWLEQLKNTREKGVILQRVRIVSLPLSDYIFYEIDFWKHSLKKGEKISFLTEREYKILIRNLHFKPRDFLMSDDKVLILFHYNKKGNFVKEELIKEKKKIQQYLTLKEELMRKAIPMRTFLKTIKELRNLTLI